MDFLGDPAPKWFIELDEFVLEDDSAWLDEWVHHAQTFALPHIEPLGWSGGFRGTGDLVTPMRMEIGNPPAESYETPRLWLMKVPGWERPRVFVVGWSEDADDASESDDVGFWPEVVRSAMEAVGNSDQDFDWFAVIGPALGSSNLHRHVHLTSPGRVGPIALVGDDGGYSEYETTRVAMLGTGGHVFSWWPLIASGTARGHDFPRAQRSITPLLHRVCGLLSVAWDSCLTVRAHTQPGEFRAIPPGPAGSVHEDLKLLRREVEIPDWGQEAWHRLEDSAMLRDALAIYHQGCLLEGSHPSFALTAFVSTVETVAQLNKGAKHCPECNQVLGSGQRFKEAVSRVLPEDIAEFVGGVYKPRSGTVHRGLLHGDESKVGHVNFGPLFDRPEDNFRYATVRYTKQAARALMLEALGAHDD